MNGHKTIIINLTIKIEKLAQAPYSKLWIIGDAVSKRMGYKYAGLNVQKSK